jgi:ABC-type transport system involved in multi-copper enzyme maturation permease subunit
MTKQDAEIGALVEKPAFAFIDRWLSTRWNFFTRLAENPVVMKELRGRMRGRRSSVLLSSYLGLIALIIGIIYFLVSREASYTQWDPEFRQTMGKVTFSAVVLLELLMVTFIGPALTAGGISAEREKQTFDLLRTTLLSARALVWGKLGSALAYLLLLIFAAMPIEGLAFLLGGVGLGELLVSSLMLVVTALFFCSLGLFFSSFVKRTLAATVSSYATILVSSLLLVLGLFVVTYFMNSSADMSSAFENMLSILLWIMISTNPLLSAIISEIILVEDQSLFVTNSILGNNLSLPSPWILFTIIYMTMTLLLIFLSIRFVNRPDR